ncbi:ORF 0.75, putative [Entamoeba histolytica HM-3:IMSS]|nr:ORF 0.75, putative [Entamoeba histolytica KU27]EMS14944.1 ORF 0.75, putative [Entamoeba histolytica HM-3:IMSS]ENY65392.1 hypothetical protein EHI7A_160290 [Entamoeba histolytica HM-1:IMSS-A]GAT93284.1 hypothetical protein CL6EHI_159490 [Entamoeba histolytica]
MFKQLYLLQIHLMLSGNTLTLCSLIMPSSIKNSSLTEDSSINEENSLSADEKSNLDKIDKGCCEEITPKYPKEQVPKFKFKHWNETNLQVELQSICLCLLSAHCKIVVGKPNRYSSLTKQFVKIKEIEFNRFDSINVIKFTKDRVSMKMCLECSKQNINAKTALRRLQPIKKKIVMNLLIDLLIEFGYLFEIQKETKEGYEGLVRIFHKNTLLMETKEVREKGHQYNIKITSQLAQTTPLTLTPSFFKDN